MASSFGRRKSNRGSLIVMFSALTLFFVYLATIVPELRILFYLVASLFVLGIMLERRTLAAILSFVAVLIIGFILVPDKRGMLPYMLLFGHYGIFKYIIDERATGIGNIMPKLIYFLVGITLIYFLDGNFMLELIPSSWPLWLVLAIFAAIFLLYDWLYTMLARWYYGTIRNRLLGGRT